MDKLTQLATITTERERIESPIDTDLLREGEAIMAAAEDGTLPPTAPTPDILSHEAAVRFAAGYDAEDIADMNPDERAAEVAEALTQASCRSTRPRRAGAWPSTPRRRSCPPRNCSRPSGRPRGQVPPQRPRRPPL